MRTTGWPAPALMQDHCPGLSKWLASRPNAKQEARRAVQKKIMCKVDTSPEALRAAASNVGYEEAAILRAVAAEKEAQGWQPIETAPFAKRVLLWWRTADRPLQGRYVCDERGEGWICDGDMVMPRNQEDCVLWAPLPEGPKT